MSAQNPGGAPVPDQAYEGGSGTPLLLLHGIGGSWHMWKPVLKPLEAHHRVIALTLPGHCDGPDCTAPGDATVGGLADQVIRMMEQRGFTSAHVAGNSLGGWLSLELARRGFARSVTALSPAGGWSRLDSFARLRRRFRIFFALMPIILFLASPFLRFAGFRKLLGKETMEHGDRVPADEFRYSLRAMTKCRAFLGLLRTMGRDGPVDPIGPARVPIRIAWSEHDRVIPFETFGEHIMNSIDGAEKTIVNGAGHVPMYDEPAQVVAQILEVTARAERDEAQQDGPRPVAA